MVKINHFGVLNSTDEEARIFYSQILGLKEEYSFEIADNLAQKIFNLKKCFKVIVFSNDNLKFEVFISQETSNLFSPINHICLEVDDRQEFVEKCRKLGVEVVETNRSGRKLIFVKDFSGNLFEIKELLA
ncbi:MAG: VOC family protein [Caldisericaceae bacterium]|nr:VOC family protein [Caldisericaceae bacterium]